ncbi:transposase [uncultured Oscillibacter sp.]
MPWRDLPERFGPCQSVYSRFRAWTKAGVWERILSALIEQDLVSHQG